MAALRDRPRGNSNFLVELATGSARPRELGFAEVIFPPFAIAPGRQATAPTPAPAADAVAVAVAASRHLFLKRGATGALDLYTWWDQARRGKAPRRRVATVKLLAEDHATVVLTWRFLEVRPVSLLYSPLQALDGGILMETIELSFDAVEMS